MSKACDYDWLVHTTSEFDWLEIQIAEGTKHSLQAKDDRPFKQKDRRRVQRGAQHRQPGQDFQQRLWIRGQIGLDVVRKLQFVQSRVGVVCEQPWLALRSQKPIRGIKEFQSQNQRLRRQRFRTQADWVQFQTRKWKRVEEDSTQQSYCRSLLPRFRNQYSNSAHFEKSEYK